MGVELLCRYCSASRETSTMWRQEEGANVTWEEFDQEHWCLEAVDGSCFIVL